MIGTHEEWKLLREVRDLLESLAPYSKTDVEVCKRFNKLCRCFEVSEQSFLNHNEEIPNGVECKQPS